MEAGHRHHASEERNSEGDRHPHLQGGDRAENWECYSESVVGKEVIYRCKIEGQTSKPSSRAICLMTFNLTVEASDLS